MPQLPASFHPVHRGQFCELWQADKTAVLVFDNAPRAGAIGSETGQDFLTALERVTDAEQLILCVNSAGARFDEPLQGLLQLNGILERLWQLKTAGLRITVASGGHLYGGMAMALCACADEIRLGETARLGLFGARVSNEALAHQPALDCQPTEAELVRCDMNDWLAALPV